MFGYSLGADMNKLPEPYPAKQSEAQKALMQGAIIGFICGLVIGAVSVMWAVDSKVYPFKVQAVRATNGERTEK